MHHANTFPALVPPHHLCVASKLIDHHLYVLDHHFVSDIQRNEILHIGDSLVIIVQTIHKSMVLVL